MRVAIFFDGKNFYSAQKFHGIRGRTDFVALSKWLVGRVGGSVLTGCHYYTGVEAPGGGPAGLGGEPLMRFLDMLEHQPGYFVYKFPRKVKTYDCEHCGKNNVFTQEKEVDTKIVADMLRLAAVGAFDIAILISGDADHAPAVEGLRDLGKMVYVGTWGSTSLAKRIRRAAFDHINLLEGLPVFNHAEPLAEPTAPPSVPEAGGEGVAPGELRLQHQPESHGMEIGAGSNSAGTEGQASPPTSTPLTHSPARTETPATATTDVRVTVVQASAPSEGSRNPSTSPISPNRHSVFLSALRAAEAHFGSRGFVGANYFLERWTFPGFAPGRFQRQQTLNELLELGEVVATQMPDGQTKLSARH